MNRDAGGADALSDLKICTIAENVDFNTNTSFNNYVV